MNEQCLCQWKQTGLEVPGLELSAYLFLCL